MSIGDDFWRVGRLKQRQLPASESAQPGNLPSGNHAEWDCPWGQLKTNQCISPSFLVQVSWGSANTPEQAVSYGQELIQNLGCNVDTEVCMQNATVEANAYSLRYVCKITMLAIRKKVVDKENGKCISPDAT